MQLTSAYGRPSQERAARRAAMVAALPFPSAYPSLALSQARRDYARARRDELRAIKAGQERWPFASHGDKTRQRYLANLRAARRLLAGVAA